MRRATSFLLSLSLSIAACSPEETDSGSLGGDDYDTNMLENVPGSLILDAESLTTTGPSGVTVPFGSSRTAAEAALKPVLGKPQDRAEMSECGAGPMEATEFSKGVTVNFVDGRLAGWYLGEETDGQAKVLTTHNIGVGSLSSDVTRMYDLIEVPDSTLGDEFYSEEEIGGFFEKEGDERKVAALYAGTNCFFR